MSRLAIISALVAEARCFSPQNNLLLRQIVRIDQTDLFISGMGEKNARSAALALINNGAKALVSWGTAGALSKTLKPGDVIISEKITNEAGQQFQTSDLWRNQLIEQLDSKVSIHTNTLIQSNDVVASIQQKQTLFKSSGAIAVDMESAAIAEIAEQHQLPMLAIRVIVDSAKESIPKTATRSVNEFGQTKPTALLFNLIKRPDNIPALIRLGKHFQQAQDSLRLISSITEQTLALPFVL